MKKDRKSEAAGDNGHEPEAQLPEIVTRKTKRILKVILTEAEERQFGKDIARARQELAATNDQLDEVKAQFKARLEGHEKDMNRLALLLNNGYEYRDVECEVISNYKDGQITVVRTDTGEPVEERAMTDNERQRELPVQASA